MSDVPTAHLRRAGRTASTRLSEGVSGLRGSWRVILQATVAAVLAYLLAEAIGHTNPFFAPIAAISTVAISLAHRLRRASELVVGNAIGILLADLLIAQIGTGAWQLGLIVAVALVTALLAGGGPILIMQSSSSAILIATLAPPTDAVPWNIERFLDALIGGGIGLLVAALLMPVDPVRTARQATMPVLTTLAEGYTSISRALAAGDSAAADATLADLRATQPVVAGFHAGLDATRESVRLAPWYWGQRTVVASYALAGFHLDNALRNLRVLARQAAAALHRGDRVPPELPSALELLATAAQGLEPVLAGEAAAEAVLDDLQEAIAQATGLLGDGEVSRQAGPFLAPLVGQVRLSASDLLQAAGLSNAESRALIGAAAGDADPLPEP
jgi:uncharacterized membrane protein YgaE (UPF0421/DUF939 family)